MADDDLQDLTNARKVLVEMRHNWACGKAPKPDPSAAKYISVLRRRSASGPRADSHLGAIG